MKETAPVAAPPLAGWRRETQTLILAALLAAIVGMLVSIVRYLKEQHRRLDIAVNNMSQGLLLFDASERLVAHNQQYPDMFRLSPEIVRWGTDLVRRELIKVHLMSFHLDLRRVAHFPCIHVRKAGEIGVPTASWLDRMLDRGGARNNIGPFTLSQVERTRCSILGCCWQPKQAE